MHDIPITLVDIGSSGGIAPVWRTLRSLTVVEFEPDERAPNPQRDWPKRRIVLRTPLWESNREMDFHLTAKQQASSLFKPNTELFARYPRAERVAVNEVRKMRVDTLENQLREASVEWVDFIKLDAQGAELAILRGAERLMRACVVGLEIEVEFLPLYHGQPLFGEVDAYVRSLGFELFELRPTQWSYAAGGNETTRGQIAFADALYFRAPETLICMRQADSLKTIATLFGRPDFAAHVAQFNLKSKK